MIASWNSVWRTFNCSCNVVIEKALDTQYQIGRLLSQETAMFNGVDGGLIIGDYK